MYSDSEGMMYTYGQVHRYNAMNEYIGRMYNDMNEYIGWII